MERKAEDKGGDEIRGEKVEEEWRGEEMINNPPNKMKILILTKL